MQKVNLNPDQMYQLLSHEAFHNYCSCDSNVRVVFADYSYYFEIFRILTGAVHEVCYTVQQLNEYFLKKGASDGEGPACKDE